MLPNFYREFDRAELCRIEKTVSGEDASTMGAFSFGTRVTYTVKVSRRLGAAAVVLRLWRDGENAHDTPLSFVSSEGGVDHYTLTLDTSELCDTADGGLFYYYFLIVRGADTRFTSSINNVDFSLREWEDKPFRLLVYAADYTPPTWFFGGTMYHIFVDRFYRGRGRTKLRRGATLDPDWENGIPQFAAYPGAPLANDRFFGGNLYGITEKLDYLASLGVTVLYLSPIFEAASNHKYDTADYETVDPLFGGEVALQKLIEQANKRGIRIILDGVFNHTGDDSRYFNRYGRYEGLGAYQSPDSPYANWYTFRDFPDEYDAWWGISILPRLNSALPAVKDYLAGHDGIAAGRVRSGISGWRLDVADELSDEFLDTLRQSLHSAAKETGAEQPIIIGEVWENAADKMAYGHRRRYFGGKQLDSVMNYPLRQALIAFVRDGDAEQLYNTLIELYASYPRPVCHALMNLIGTHDTARILTVLGDPTLGEGKTNTELSVTRLSPRTRATAIKRLRMALTLLFTVYGVPSLFYGDEAGMEGYHDPFCRMPYPWGRENESLIETVRFLGHLRRREPCLSVGDFRVLLHTEHAIAYERNLGDSHLIVAANRGEQPLILPLDGVYERVSMDSTRRMRGDELRLTPDEFCILREVKV